MRLKPPSATPDLQRHVECLLLSYRHFLGRDLIAPLPRESLLHRLFEAPFAVVSHNHEADPLLNYGNGIALKLWEMEWKEFTGTPSRLTAELPEREKRERLLAQVQNTGWIGNYSGVRISKSGRRFRIEEATLWNLIDAGGKPVGQAAAFSKWRFLE